MSAKAIIRGWLGIDYDVQQYRQYLADSREETDRRMRLALTQMLNTLQAQSEQQTEKHIRDNLAALAMQAVITHSGWEPIQREHNGDITTVMAIAYLIADEMIKQRIK